MTTFGTALGTQKQPDIDGYIVVKREEAADAQAQAALVVAIPFTAPLKISKRRRIGSTKSTAGN